MPGTSIAPHSEALMVSSPMTAPAQIVHLVELFKSNYDQYRSPAFTEAAVRHQFIDPFFAANKQSLVQRVDNRSHAQGVHHM